MGGSIGVLRFTGANAEGSPELADYVEANQVHTGPGLSSEQAGARAGAADGEGWIGSIALPKVHAVLRSFPCVRHMLSCPDPLVPERPQGVAPY